MFCNDPDDHLNEYSFVTSLGLEPGPEISHMRWVCGLGDFFSQLPKKETVTKKGSQL